jgi:hypothetical protein
MATFRIYGNDELVEYSTQLVVVPRICEVCLGHPAVYYDCSWWPASYICTLCLGSEWLAQRWDLHAQAAELSDFAIGNPGSTLERQVWETVSLTDRTVD